MIPGPFASMLLVLLTFIVVVIIDRTPWRAQLRHITIAGLIAALAALGALGWTGAVSEFLRFDLFTLFFAFIVLLAALFTALGTREQSFVFMGSLLFLTLGMLVSVAANDLLVIVLGIELMSVPSYALIAYHKTPKRIEAAAKYFMISVLSSALLLLGVVLLAVSSGDTALAALAPHEPALFAIGVGTFLAGLAFKLSLFPFNLWVPDVYQGAPPEVAALLAGGSKKAAFAILLRVAVLVAPVVHHWTTLLAIIAALTMTIPNLIALAQHDARRLLAYSILSHAGFLLMGIAIGTAAGLSAMLVHAFVHTLMAMGAFLILGLFALHGLESVESLHGLGYRNPYLGALLTIFLLSLTGIPLFAGFVSKFLLFSATIESGLLWLAIVGILNSAIALYYYFRIIRSLYAYRGAGRKFAVRKGMMVAVTVCALLILFIGVYPEPVVLFARAAVAALVG